MDCETERATFEFHARKNILKFGQADNTETLDIYNLYKDRSIQYAWFAWRKFITVFRTIP
jgi:hypothetical protein